jgi:hypothetical protein
MSVVSLLGVEVKNNPAPFGAPYEFEITFECLEQLQAGEFLHTLPQTLANMFFAQISNGSSLMSDLPPREYLKTRTAAHIRLADTF